MCVNSCKSNELANKRYTFNDIALIFLNTLVRCFYFCFVLTLFLNVVLIAFKNKNNQTETSLRERNRVIPFDKVVGIKHLKIGSIYFL